MAKTRKHLKIEERHIYNPEIDDCPHCGEPLQARRHYQWRKTVQQMDKVVYVASRGKECVNLHCQHNSTLSKFVIGGWASGKPKQGVIE